MATAKLWWNGSSWVTSSTNWLNQSKTGNNQVAIGNTVMIAVWDDFTIRVTQSNSCWQTASLYWYVGFTDNSIYVNGNGNRLGTGNFSNVVATNYRTFSVGGSATAQGSAGNQGYSSGALWFSGSTTVSEPFFTITYDVNGGSGAVGTQKVIRGITAKVTPAATPTRTNYSFIGWNTKADGTGTSFSNGSNISTTLNITLYAQWTQTAFLVTVEADEGATITFDGQSFSGESTSFYKAGGTYAVTITANAGYIIKTRSPASDGNVTISDNTTVLSATSQHVGCRIDDGAQWVQALIYVDDGAQWVMCQAYYDDGAQWNLLN